MNPLRHIARLWSKDARMEARYESAIRELRTKLIDADIKIQTLKEEIEKHLDKIDQMEVQYVRLRDTKQQEIDSHVETIQRVSKERDDLRKEKQLEIETHIATIHRVSDERDLARKEFDEFLVSMGLPAKAANASPALES